MNQRDYFLPRLLQYYEISLKSINITEESKKVQVWEKQDQQNVTLK